MPQPWLTGGFPGYWAAYFRRCVFITFFPKYFGMDEAQDAIRQFLWMNGAEKFKVTGGDFVSAVDRPNLKSGTFNPLVMETEQMAQEMIKMKYFEFNPIGADHGVKHRVHMQCSLHSNNDKSSWRKWPISMSIALDLLHHTDRDG